MPLALAAPRGTAEYLPPRFSRHAGGEDRMRCHCITLAALCRRATDLTILNLAACHGRPQLLAALADLAPASTTFLFVFHQASAADVPRRLSPRCLHFSASNDERRCATSMFQAITRRCPPGPVHFQAPRGFPLPRQWRLVGMLLKARCLPHRSTRIAFFRRRRRSKRLPRGRSLPNLGPLASTRRLERHFMGLPVTSSPSSGHLLPTAMAKTPALRRRLPPGASPQCF